jgi:hypothetical protein
MRYFTPELYLAGNSTDEDVVDAAEVAWDKATEAYRAYLDSVKHHMPSGVRELAEACFHDAEVVATRSHVVLPPAPHGVVTPIAPMPTYAILLLDAKEPISVTYFLWDVTRIHAAVDAWRFGSRKVYWLYEEMEARQGPGELWFRHKILLSNGTVLEIPFTDAFVMRSLSFEEAAAG